MFGRRMSRRGLSEIVGALMLVLIVVSAATVFAIFAAQYQKTLQQQQAQAQARSLESLGILRATPSINSTGLDWSTVNFTLASLYINPMIISEITINDNPLRQYTAIALNLTSGHLQSVTVGPGGELNLAPREQVNVVVNCSLGSPSYSFYNGSGFTLPVTTYVKVEVFTALQNIFTRVFIPPTALGVVGTIETLNGTGFTSFPLLDGSQSFQPVNGSLVAWNWAVTPDNGTAVGEKAIFSFNTAFHIHHIVLTVTNSDGFLGIDKFDYTT